MAQPTGALAPAPVGSGTVRTTTPGRTTRRPLAWAGFVLVCVLAGRIVFRASLGLPFIGDDFGEIARATGGDGWLADAVFLRPVLQASLWLDHAIAGLDPARYHSTNVWLHTANAVLVAALVSQVLRSAHRGDPGPTPPAPLLVPMLAGWLFLLMPHSEAVHWVSARADLLATSFSLLSLIGLVMALRTDGTRRAAVTVATLLALAGALASKESAVVVPVLLTCTAAVLSPLDRPSSRWTRLTRALALTTPAYLLAAAYLVVRVAVLDSPAAGYGSVGTGPTAILRLVRNYAAALLRTFVPAAPVWFAALVAVAVLGAAVVWLSLGRRRGRPATWSAVRTLVVWSTAGLLVGVIPAAFVGVSVTASVGDRLTYLPSVFAAALVAVALAGLRQRRPEAMVVATALLTLAFVGLDLREGERWREAGVVSEIMADALSSRPPGEVYLVHLPTTVEGAYSFVNGAIGLGWFLGDADPGPVRTVSTAHVGSFDDAVSVGWAQRDDGWVLRVDGEPGDRMQVLDGDWTVLRADPGSIEVAFPDDVYPAQVLYYSAGELRAIGQPDG